MPPEVCEPVADSVPAGVLASDDDVSADDDVADEDEDVAADEDDGAEVDEELLSGSDEPPQADRTSAAVVTRAASACGSDLHCVSW